MSYEISFDRKKLLEGLKCVDVAVEKKTAILQHFKCVRISIDKGRVLLQGMNQGVSCDYLLNDLLTGEGIEEINVVGLVEHAKLLHIISKSKRDIIKMEWEPESSLVIKAEGRSTLKFINVASYDMQPTDDITIVKEDVKASELADIWKATEFTISDDINRYDLRGILYDGSWVTSTGSHISIVKTDEPELDDKLLIIPAFDSFIKLVSSSSLGIKKMEMRRHKDRHLVMVVHTDIGKMRYMISLSNYEFPAWRKFEAELLIKCTNQFSISRDELSDILDRIGIFVDAISKFIILDISPDHMEVTARSMQTGQKTVEQISFCEPAPTISEPLHVSVSYDILRKISTENSEEIINFRYGDMRTPLLLILGQKEYVVAPMVEVMR